MEGSAPCIGNPDISGVRLSDPTHLSFDPTRGSNPYGTIRGRRASGIAMDDFKSDPVTGIPGRTLLECLPETVKPVFAGQGFAAVSQPIGESFLLQVLEQEVHIRKIDLPPVGIHDGPEKPQCNQRIAKMMHIRKGMHMGQCIHRGPRLVDFLQGIRAKRGKIKSPPGLRIRFISGRTWPAFSQDNCRFITTQSNFPSGNWGKWPLAVVATVTQCVEPGH